MPTYLVGMRLVADNADALLERLHNFEAPTAGEGITTISMEPETIEIPPGLRAPPPEMPGSDFTMPGTGTTPKGGSE
jgi:hypothetical protein